MIQIDPAFAVLFAASSVVMALILCVILRRHRRGDDAIKWLMASNLLLFGAALGVLLRPLVGFEFGAFMVLIGAYAGICCGFFAILRAEGQALPWRLYTGIGLVAMGIHGAVLVFAAGEGALMVSSSLVNSAVTLMMLLAIRRLTLRHGPAISTLLTLPFAALCFTYLMRLPVLAIWGGGGAAVTASLLIIVVMAWSAVVLELGLIALRERQARQRLAQAKRDLEAARDARTRVLLGISHEFRTPMNAIGGLTALLRAGGAGKMDDKMALFVDQIADNSDQLSALITRLLDCAEGEDAPNLTDGDTLERAIRWKFDAMAEDAPSGTDKAA